MALLHEEPILSKLNRLDNMLREVEEIRGSSVRSSSSPQKSSFESTPSSGTLASDGHVSSIDDFSPKSLQERHCHCRPMDRVVLEAEAKGTLVDRLHALEDRLQKVCLEMEKGLVEGERNKGKKKPRKGGLKQLVKKCVKAAKHKP